MNSLLNQLQPSLVGLNKNDVLKRSEIGPDDEARLASLEKEGIPIMEMSTITQQGIS